MRSRNEPITSSCDTNDIKTSFLFYCSSKSTKQPTKHENMKEISTNICMYHSEQMNCTYQCLSTSHILSHLQNKVTWLLSLYSNNTSRTCLSMCGPSWSDILWLRPVPNPKTSENVPVVPRTHSQLEDNDFMQQLKRTYFHLLDAVLLFRLSNEMAAGLPQ